MKLENHPRTGEVTSASLLVELREQNEAAWSQFVEIYAPLIYTWCRRAGCTPDDAGDMLQTILVKVWSGLRTYRESHPSGSFRAWLATVTRNALTDVARRGDEKAEGGTQALQRLQVIPEVTEHSTVVLDSDLRDLAKRAAAIVHQSLPAESQRLIELAIFQDLPAPEVAAILNCSPAAVRKAKSRLLQKLRDMLGEFD
ncbi:RNA polymerase sigma factor [Anatilimnocola aggregata]|nr:sigma-70 family RNA polymerase sigma factor [Anatilimnocola aggregata]